VTTDADDRLRGVVFDLDGVLVESEHLWEENWTLHAAANDYAWQPADTATVQGMSVPEWSTYMAERIGRGAPREIAEAVIDGMIGALHGGRVELLPGAPEMVAAAARVPIAVASSAPRRLIAAVLEFTGLLPHFTAFVSSEEVARGKPSPDVYLEAARRIGVPATACAGVEDSSNGIRAAAAAGMTVVAIPNPVYPPRPDALALCAKIAASPDDARRFLVEQLDAPEAVRNGEARRDEPTVVRSRSSGR
jgi:HAD superfamily hydrolase (TIGR01509 family)